MLPFVLSSLIYFFKALIDNIPNLMGIKKIIAKIKSVNPLDIILEIIFIYPTPYLNN